MYNIVVLGIVSLLTDVSTEMVYPLLPVFLTATLGASPAILGVIEGMAESLASLLRVFSGYIGDQTKRKKELTIAGYGSSTLGKVFLFFAGSWGMVLLARLVDRLGKGIRTAPRDALIADSAQAAGRGRAFGLHRAMDTFGAAAGVAISYLLLTKTSSVNDAVSFKRIFLLSMIPALLGVLALFWLHPAKKAKTSTSFTFSWSHLDSRLRAFLVLAFVFALGNSSNQFLLLRASRLGAGLPMVVLMYLVYNLSYGLLSYPGGYISDKLLPKRILVMGYLIYGVVYFAFARVTRISSLWLLFTVYGFYTAFTHGVEKALLADIAPVNLRGTVLGLHAAIVGVALLPASLLAGFLWNTFGAPAPFLFGSAMGFAAAIGLLIIL
ncbi:Major facilitator superfamily transporter [Acididesulfobacillus acetoxydans]|uniref:Major facilitator superfamily transporter n=1 Tax=Acididesulfobacillus acetoxydans TaxID=1561005 RepID=A0A8S0VX05_9FIRM|nr:MFS transporter [Acididesulfobacillus acetoxydans]CAA7601433.1 Major facilitator superfamily transporter [Acididesulfobacillus acetoxydans]CEJ08864.1 Permeases of the major facilitator super [Acididesulfobacillus acetoxydans]